MLTKKCTVCGVEKDLSKFTLDKRNSQGVTAMCRVCTAWNARRYSRHTVLDGFYSLCDICGKFRSTGNHTQCASERSKSKYARDGVLVRKLVRKRKTKPVTDEAEVNRTMVARRRAKEARDDQKLIDDLD